MNKFRIAQRPLKIVTPNGWTWNVDELTLGGSELTAMISPREPTAKE